MAEDAVIGYIHPGTVRAEFAASLLAVCLEGKTRIRTVIALESGPNVSTGRNMIVREFLDGNLAPWLFMADTDMAFAADAVDRLIAAGKPVIGALTWSLSAGQQYPTMYELAELPGGELAFRRHREWPDDTPVRVSATGAACLLMHRDALLAVERHCADPPAPWFRESAAGGKLALIGEDMTFCLRCAAAGIPVHVHTGVQCGHVKPVMLGKVR